MTLESLCRHFGQRGRRQFVDVLLLRRRLTSHPAVSRWSLGIEKDGFGFALEPDVETEDTAVLARDQGRAPARIDLLQDRVGGVGGLLVREVDPGDEMAEESASVNGEVQVGRLAGLR